MFGCDEVRCTDDRAAVKLRSDCFVEKTDQPKILDLGVSFGCHQYIAGFDIAMQHPLLVRVLQSACRLIDDRSGLLHVEPPVSADHTAQIRAGYILGDQKVHVAIVSRVQCAHQVAMIELCLSANLEPESRDRLGCRFFFGQHFDGHDAVHHRVLGFEDLAHASLTDRIEDAVGTETKSRAARKQLIGLPTIQLTQLDQFVGELPICGKGLRGVRASLGAQMRFGTLQVGTQHEAAVESTCAKIGLAGRTHWRSTLCVGHSIQRYDEAASVADPMWLQRAPHPCGPFWQAYTLDPQIAKRIRSIRRDTSPSRSSGTDAANDNDRQYSSVSRNA